MTLKITKEVDPRGDLDVDPLYVGDGITFSVTHEVLIDGEKSWIKYGGMTTVQPGEGTDGAYARLVRHVNAGALQGVEDAVKSVRGYVAQQPSK